MTANDFRKTCARCAVDQGYMKVYRFTKSDLAPVRLTLINMNKDEAQEEFFLDLLKSPEEPVEVSAQIIEHLIEYLQGAL